VIEATGLADSAIRQLAADHAAASEAVSALDVTADLTEAAADTARRLGLDPGAPHVLAALLKFASRCYRHGHVDRAEQGRAQDAAPLLVPMLGRSR
jgi:hypothetical protein